MRLWIFIGVFCLSGLSACKTTPKEGGVGASQGSLPWQTGGGAATQTSPAPNHGKVATVNRELKFAVLDFALARLPGPDLRLGVYRNGARVGEVTTTRMVDDTFLVADINRGDIRQGDDVRPE